MSLGLDIGTMDAMNAVANKNNMSPKVSKLIEAL